MTAIPKIPIVIQKLRPFNWSTQNRELIGLFFVSDLSKNENMYFLKTTPERTIAKMKMPTKIVF